jgi:hypothetical protein
MTETDKLYNNNNNNNEQEEEEEQKMTQTQTTSSLNDSPYTSIHHHLQSQSRHYKQNLHVFLSLSHAFMLVDG